MKKVVVILKPHKAKEVEDALHEIGIRGMTILEAQYVRKDQNLPEVSLPRLTMEIVLEEHMLDRVLDTIVEAAQTGRVYDGHIFVSNMEDAIRVRTGQRGVDAI